jgi:uncharacterized protein (DUF58 family)
MPSPIDPTALSRYGGLALIARTLVEGYLTGVHKSPYKGYSVEFAEHRQYYPGDEIRHLDWRVLAKTDRYFIKEFEEETNLKAYLLVDASGSMAYRGRQRSKFEYAQHVAACLAYLMLHQLDAVGLVTHDTRIRHVLPPRANAKHLLHVLQILEHSAPGGETALAPIWHELAGHQIRRRGMVIILSDCFDELDRIVLALRHFRHRRQEVILLHVLAPEEIEFPFRRLTQFQNLESEPDKMLVDPARLRKEYLERFGEFCRQLRDRCHGMGVDYHLLRTDEPVDRALGIYLSRRHRQS